MEGPSPKASFLGEGERGGRDRGESGQDRARQGGEPSNFTLLAPCFSPKDFYFFLRRLRLRGREKSSDILYITENDKGEKERKDPKVRVSFQLTDNTKECQVGPHPVPTTFTRGSKIPRQQLFLPRLWKQRLAY